MSSKQKKRNNSYVGWRVEKAVFEISPIHNLNQSPIKFDPPVQASTHALTAVRTYLHVSASQAELPPVSASSSHI